MQQNFSFTSESMLTILKSLTKALKTTENLNLTILNPDSYSHYYAGTTITLENETYIYRSLRSWMDLATQLGCRMLTPTPYSKELTTLHFQKLHSDSFHQDQPQKKSEKYGVDSHFSAINKNEEPAFLTAYLHALELAHISGKRRILNLGVNQGDEFALIQEIVTAEQQKEMTFVGVDHSQSTTKVAQERFTSENFHFYAHDINEIDTLNLEPFDLIITIGTLQSPGINYKPFLQKLVQEYLSKEGALILGFPNSRWIDGEMIYGAKMRNYRESDLSLLLNDIDYAKRYLQQKKFKVRISGKEYLFLTAYK